jgi:hypothetical protein
MHGIGPALAVPGRCGGCDQLAADGAPFLTESIVLSGLGGLAGVTLGVLATGAYAGYKDWPPVIPVPAVSGRLAGAAVIVPSPAYPAMRASRLPPTATLASTFAASGSGR